jgi:hypothetical protein
MGFETARTFTLQFEGTEWDGAEVKLRSMSIKKLREFLAADLDTEIRMLSEHLIEWNLEINGKPIPLTPEGVGMLEEPAKNLIVVSWLKATRGISAPLERQSGGGDTSEVPQMTMETL